MQRRSLLTLMAAAAIAAGLNSAAKAAEEEVTVGYQLIYGPWLTAIADRKFEQATGRAIRWVKFDSGAKVINAMASGDVDIGVAGSSPIAAAASRGLDIELFWILDDIAEAEALVARDGSGIEPKDPKTLVGKRLGVPFVSTTHFHTLYALEVWGLDPAQVKILNMQPNEIAAAWERGDIDAAFVWDPALARIKRNGQVMITSGELSAKGKPTFDGLIVNRTFAEANKDFMAKFVRVIAEADAAYRSNAAAWSAESAQVKAIVNLVGGEPADVPPGMALYGFPTPEEQTSCTWLGCGQDGGAVKALRFTAEFLKAQGRVDALQPDYARFVNPAYAEAAMTLGKGG